MASAQRNPRSDYFPDMSKFKVTGRPLQSHTYESEVINRRFIDTLLRTQDTTKAVTFNCAPSWQKRICDNIYSFVRKQHPKLTVHRVCSANHVNMWVAPLVNRTRPAHEPLVHPTSRVLAAAKHPRKPRVV